MLNPLAVVRGIDLFLLTYLTVVRMLRSHLGWRCSPRKVVAVEGN
jgi:hypothetical protein